jgi:hypothetical protein
VNDVEWLGNGVFFHIGYRRDEISLGNCVVHTNRAASHDLGPQSTAMDQSS